MSKYTRASDRKRRTIAGSSGGIFNISVDVTGSPTYQYQPGFGRRIIENGGIEKAYDVDGQNTVNADDALDRDIKAVNPNERTTSTADVSRRTSVHSGSGLQEDDIEPNDSILQEIKNMKAASTDTDSGKKHTWGTSASKLKNKASNIQHRLKARLSTLKFPRLNENKSTAKYEVAFDSGTDDENEDTTDADQNAYTAFEVPSSHVPRYFDPQPESRPPQFEDGYFSTLEDHAQAEANFKFFCSMPHPNEDESSTTDSDSKANTNKEGSYSSAVFNKSYNTLSRDMRNHYEVLSLTQSCDDASIMTRARRLIASLHPDKISSRTPEQKATDTQECARISLAKTELLDYQLRAKHDREIEAGTWAGEPYV